MSFAAITLVGNLGRDPELKYTSNGNAVCEISVAFKSGRDQTAWLKCSVWGKRGEALAQHARKGSCLQISGRVEEERWTSMGGDENRRWVCKVSEWSFVGPRPSAEPRQEPQEPAERGAAQVDQLANEVGDDDNLPF
jgi:single-strand DNA-binding protein